MDKATKACDIAIEIANDDSHGYSQYNRWLPDFDCSSLVIYCYEKAGVPVKTNGATYTGNMLSAFLKSGFRIIDRVKEQLVKGDVLLNVKNHTAIYIGNNKIVQATIAENNTIHGQTGDQTGKEIAIYNYYNYPWDYILRYVENEKEKKENKKQEQAKEIAVDVSEFIYYSLNKTESTKMPILKMNDYGPAVIAMQSALNYHGFISKDRVTGGFGLDTNEALKRFQSVHKLEIDGICGAITWNELMYWR